MVTDCLLGVLGFSDASKLYQSQDSSIVGIMPGLLTERYEVHIPTGERDFFFV